MRPSTSRISPTRKKPALHARFHRGKINLVDRHTTRGYFGIREAAISRDFDERRHERVHQDLPPLAWKLLRCDERIECELLQDCARESLGHKLAEHIDLQNAIRNSIAINKGEKVAKSSLVAIMGRMAARSGKDVTWDQALCFSEEWMPEAVEFGPRRVALVAVPGVAS